MAREHRTARVEAELLAQLERLARQRLVPTTFAEQVDAGLRLLVSAATHRQLEHSAQLLAADHHRAERAFEQLHGSRR